jgi:hypothetical protein
MSKWWHTLATIGMAAVTVAAPAVQGAIAAHGTVSIILGTIWAVLGHLLPSPVAQ